MKIQFTLNGRAVSWQAEPGMSLRDLLRSKGLVSVRNACDGEGSCGLCSVILDGRVVNSCQILAPQAEDLEVYTVEFFSRDRSLSIVQKALVESGCVQCGYCTPAVVLALHKLLERSPEPARRDVEDALSSILCRCTGYEQFFGAARLAAARLKDPNYAARPAPEFRDDLRHVGKCREKIDAPSLARGERAFVEDRLPPDALALRLLGSPHARAYIRSIDTTAAERMPGVHAVVSFLNTPDRMYTTAGQGFPEPSPYDQRMFSRVLRFVGDRVAAVLAETEAEAEAALAAIKVEYEVLKPVLTIEEAEADGAPPVHAGPVTYVAGEAPTGSVTTGDASVYGGADDPVLYQFPIGADPLRNLAASTTDGIGDVEKGLAEADVVIEREYYARRVHCTPMEPHVVLTRMDGGRLVIHASTQVPWHLRRIVAGAIGVPENKVRVIKERVGGGFGVKQDIVLEDVASWLTWTTGKTVFFRYTREEEFVASRTRHPMKIRVKLGAKRDGRLTAIDFHLRADTGAYGEHCLTVPMNSCSKSLPLLLCDNVRFDVKSYYTNLPASGAYQGYGAPQGSFALQTALAELASELGMDQLDIIEKNRVRSGSRIEILKSLGEGRAGAAVTLGECGLGEMIERGRKSIAWDDPSQGHGKTAECISASGTMAGHGAAGHADADWRLGRAAVIIQQGSGLPGLDAANAEIRLLDDGGFMLLSGGADLGTGLDTLTGKVCAEVLKVDPKDVTVLSGDTDATPFDKGAYASSGTFFSGNAARLAAVDLLGKVLAVAAEELHEPAHDLTVLPGGVIAGKNGKTTSYAAIGHLTATGEGHGELAGHGSFKTEHAAFPYGAHFVQVAVNVRTGDVVLRRYHAYQDCGTPINPELAMGQIYGGVLKAVGHSLYEEMLFDGEGRCVNANFLDYKIPSIREMPEDFRVELVPVEDPVGPYGGKSVSEISLNGAAPAIAIAIHDACGVWVREWPFTPERVLHALGKL
jgi:putative selenate reductase molybdopterin-binding subunit